MTKFRQNVYDDTDHVDLAPELEGEVIVYIINWMQPSLSDAKDHCS